MSISANEFVPSFPVVDVGFETINSSAIDEPEQQLEPYLSTDQNQHQIELHGIEHGEPLLAIDPPTAHSIEEIIPQQQTECELSVAQATEPEPQSVITSSISDDKDAVASAPAELATAGAAAGAAAVAAAGAALVTVGIAKAASPKAKPSDAKKVDSKLKAAPIKKTATTTTTTTATSKVAAARTSASKTDDKSKTAAPKIASRIVASKVSTTADKKPTVTSTITRKPTSNGSKYPLILYMISVCYLLLLLKSLVKVNRKVSRLRLTKLKLIEIVHAKIDLMYFQSFCFETKLV